MENEGDTLTLTKDNLIQRSYADLETNYEIVDELGCGAYARVLKVKNKNTHIEYACKELLKSGISDIEAFNKEISILSTLDHPNIIKLYETCENDECIYLIMELCNGGELFDYLISKLEQQERFTEKEVAHIFKQLMSAVSYCHSNKISHRDLKPENILISHTSSSSSSLQIKVIDFGVSQILTEDTNVMYDTVGTAYYIAPEVLNGSYDHKCDIWSCGVILYVLLCGLPPFNGETDEEVFNAIKQGNLCYPDKLWGNVSNDVKDLITKMLCKEDIRITAEDVMKHPWVVNEAPNAKEDVELNINLNSFKMYLNANKLKKAVITYIASRLSDDEVCKLKQTFKDIDTSGDGMISLDELKNAMKCNTKNVNVKNIEMIFKQIDSDNSGVINYTEFLAACLDKAIYTQENKLKEAFRLFDLDGDGKVSKYEIMEVLKHEKSFAFVDKLLEQYDINKDGQIDYDEFKAMIINSN